MTLTKPPVLPSMNVASERDPFNNNSYGTLVDLRSPVAHVRRFP